MKDSQGNDFYVGDILYSTEALEGEGIEIIAINNGVAKFRRNTGSFDDGERYSIDQESMNVSKWIKNRERLSPRGNDETQRI
jgi:hypothetical protein